MATPNTQSDQALRVPLMEAGQASRKAAASAKGCAASPASQARGAHPTRPLPRTSRSTSSATACATRARSAPGSAPSSWRSAPAPSPGARPPCSSVKGQSLPYSARPSACTAPLLGRSHSNARRGSGCPAATASPAFRIASAASTAGRMALVMGAAKQQCVAQSTGVGTLAMARGATRSAASAEARR